MSALQTASQSTIQQSVAREHRAKRSSMPTHPLVRATLPCLSDVGSPGGSRISLISNYVLFRYMRTPLPAARPCRSARGCSGGCRGKKRLLLLQISANSVSALPRSSRHRRARCFLCYRCRQPFRKAADGQLCAAGQPCNSCAAKVRVRSLCDRPVVLREDHTYSAVAHASRCHTLVCNAVHPASAGCRGNDL